MTILFWLLVFSVSPIQRIEHWSSKNDFNSRNRTNFKEFLRLLFDEFNFRRKYQKCINIFKTETPLFQINLNNFLQEEILHESIEIFDKLAYYFVLLCLGLIVWNICAKKSSSFLLGQALT